MPRKNNYPSSRRTISPAVRLERHINKQPDGCWIWTGKKAGNYGMMSYGSPKRLMYAHRVSYLIHKGEIPYGGLVCHTCDTPLCCNPDHLFLGTEQDNHDDAVSKGRQARGDTHGRRKVSSESAAKIRRRYSEAVPEKVYPGGREIKTAIVNELAAEFGISRGQVRAIGQGKRWSHL